MPKNMVWIMAKHRHKALIFREKYGIEAAASLYGIYLQSGNFLVTIAKG